MKKEDWTGVSISLGVHLVLLIMLSLLTAAATDERPMGFLEVEFGDFKEGRPVQRAPERVDPEPDEVEPDEEVEERPAVAPPDEVKPVELPSENLDIPDEEIIETPEADIIAPEKSVTVEEEVAEEPEPEREVVQPLGSGSLTADDGTDSGDEGEATEEVASAPYRIEGLNRAPTSTPLPIYSDSAPDDVRISIRITVDPQGRIIRRIPLIKGDPNLEREVMNALLRWRFNALPVDAPQENQLGTVSFRFRRH